MGRMTKEEQWELSVSLVMVLALIGAGIGHCLAASGVAQGMARQPEVQGRLFTVFILGSAFVEALALIGFVVSLIVK